MTKKEIQEKIAEAEKAVADKQKELENLRQQLADCKEIWQPEYKDIFHVVLADGSVDPSWTSTYYLDCIAQGNFYKTWAEAEYFSKVQKYTSLFRKYVKENSDPLNWKNEDQKKVYLNYDHKTGKIESCNCWIYQRAGTIYASSGKALIDAVKFIGEENFKNYILGFAEPKEKLNSDKP